MELRRACEEGNLTAVRQLCEAGADYDMQDDSGATPLMLGAIMGHSHVLLELIRAGATVTTVTSRELWSVSAGSTALHFAAARNNIECGVLLVEAGADMRTKNKNSNSPLDLASHDFQRAIQQAQSFSTKRIVAAIGEAEHGKSTLIAALQAEGNSLLKKLTNKFRKVRDIKQRTTGIDAVQFSSQKYGETLFYDFAGQTDYHGPHQSFLEAMLVKPEVSVSLLLLVKATDKEDIITRQVTRWLQPLSLTSAPSTPQVILVGSFLDQVESRAKATEKLLRCIQSVQEHFHFNIQGPCLLDCRKPVSEGIDEICTFLQENEPLQLNCKTFSYSLRWVLVQVKKRFSVPAVTLHTFQSWLLNDAKLNPQHFPPAEQICHDLTLVGYALFFPNKQDPSHSWLILDLQAILHDVYGTLFSGTQGKVNQFGLLHCSQLTELFPKLESAMVQEVLISLEFCIQVDSSLLREELLKLTARDEGDSWLYFPALVSALPLEVFPHDPHPQHLQWACWQLRAAEKHFISAHLLQTVILRLAGNHVAIHELPKVRQHCCCIWVNGLSWRSKKGVDVAVQISDSSVVQVVGHSKAGPETLYQYMSTVVKDVIKTTAQLSPKLEATSYIIHPYTPAMWKGAKAPPPDSLYPVSSIIHCISDGGDYVLSLPRQAGRHPHQTSLAELFGGVSPPLSVVQDMDLKREPQRGLSLLEFEDSYLRKFEEHYSEVVRNQANVTLKITKCTTIGPPRVGKTCFKNLLTGQQWDVEAGTLSTDVMEAPEWVECYSLEEGGAEELWKLVSREQQQGKLLRAVNQLTTKYSDASPETTAKPRSDAFPETTAKPRSDTSPETTAKPSGETSPETTAKPRSDAFPETTAKPRSDAFPKTTAKPRSDAFPETTAKPRSDTSPETTAKPRSDTSPETTAKPSGDTSPETTAKPSGETSPETTAKPRSDAFPETTAKPRSDAFPETSAKPRSDTSPETTAKPRSDAFPETTAKPRSDAFPETTAKPRSNTSPETTAKPSGETSPETTAKPSGDAPPTTTAKPCGTPPTATAKPMQCYTATPKPIGAPPSITQFDTHHATPPSSVTHAATASSDTKVPATVWEALKALSCACSQDELEHLLKDEKGKVLGETRLIHFIDTGGQAIYHDVHPVLITSPSVYLVVFSLKELHLKSDKEKLDYFRSDLIQRPLRSIYTFGMKNPLEEHFQLRPEAPTIFIIGTHLDHISRESDCEEILDTLNCLISTEIANKPYRDLVQYDPEGRSFWAVDNTLAGREQEKGVKTCMSTLRKLVQDSSMEISVKVPLPWMLLKLVMDSKGVLYCKYSELLEEARSRGYVREDSPDADLDSMLRLFHILGLIYHKVPSECKKEDSLVFIDPNCLYSATSDLLMAAKEVVESSSNGQYLRQTGTMGEIEEHQHQTQAATEKDGEELVGIRDRQQMLEPGRIVMMTRVLQKIQENIEIIEQEMKAVQQDVLGTMARLGQEPPEVVLKSLHYQLKEMGQKYKALKCQGAMSVEKRQLFIVGLVNGLASFVKAVLCDSMRKSNVHQVREDLDKALSGMEKQCISRSIHKDDTNQFLSLLSDLRIVALTKDMDRYVIPAALPKVPWSETFAGSAEPILVTVESKNIMSACYLPSGLFCCLISELVTGLGWTVIPLGRTHVALRHVAVPGKVHVIENESYIEINLESEASQQELALACQTARKSIHEGLVRVYIDLFCHSAADPTLEESLLWGFLCERGSSDEVHIAAFHEDGGYWKECTCCHVIEEVTPPQMLWASSGLSPSELTGDVDFRLTKCITIRIQDVGAQNQLKPVQNWAQYMRYVTPEQVRCLIMSKRSDWKFANNSDILLCINIPTHQVYPLPLLITPVTCVYVVAFDLPEEEEEEKVLKEIHNTLKELYTCSSREEPDEGFTEELCITPKVFLVGLQKEKTERSGFAQHLSHMLKMRSYESLLIFPEGDDPYWSNPGADLSVNCNGALLSTIQHYCFCQPTRFIRQALICHCEMLQKFEDSPYVSFEDVEAKMADVVSGITEDSNVEQFLKVLHCFGLIFYRSLPNLKQSDNIVVLQPQYLYQLFEKAQKLSKQRDAMTIAGLLRTSQMPEPVRKWFQAVCISMGLVIEEWFGNQAEYIYVMGLDSKCDPPAIHAYRVDPLLVSYQSQQFVQRQGDCFLPSLLFPAFVTNFLKELKVYVMEQNQRTKLRDSCSNVRKRHHWCVRIHVSEQLVTEIHIVEQDSFIEIGLLQFNIGTLNQTHEQQKEKLQHFCQDIQTVVSKSAEDAVVHLRLNKPSIHYGFHVYHSEGGKAVNCFGEFHPEDNTLVCYCDPPVRQDASVLQQIWFSSVELTEHILRGPIPIRKLEARDFTDPRKATVGSSDLPNDSKTETPDTPTHFSIDSHPTLEDINTFIVREVAADWKQVATFLGVELSVIRIADTDHRQQCKHACTDIFERWLSWKPGTGRKKRTWRVVLSAVEEAGHTAFSQQFQTQYILRSPIPIRKLEARDFTDPRKATVGSSDLPSDSKTETPDPTKDIPPLSDAQIVEKVLKDFRNMFNECINVDAIKYKLKNKNIISDAEVRQISGTNSRTEQWELLHYHLQRTCTVAALIDVCDVISAVEGNPRMKVLGDRMKRRLNGLLQDVPSDELHLTT